MEAKKGDGRTRRVLLFLAKVFRDANRVRKGRERYDYTQAEERDHPVVNRSNDWGIFRTKKTGKTHEAQTTNFVRNGSLGGAGLACWRS